MVTLYNPTNGLHTLQTAVRKQYFTWGLHICIVLTAEPMFNTGWPALHLAQQPVPMTRQGFWLTAGLLLLQCQYSDIVLGKMAGLTLRDLVWRLHHVKAPKAGSLSWFFDLFNTPVFKPEKSCFREEPPTIYRYVVCFPSNLWPRY